MFIQIESILTPNWNQGELAERAISGIEKLEAEKLPETYNIRKCKNQICEYLLKNNPSVQSEIR